MVFFHSLPVPELREWFFSIPFPFPNFRNGIIHSRSRSRTPKCHSRSPLISTSLSPPHPSSPHLLHHSPTHKRRERFDRLQQFCLQLFFRQKSKCFWSINNKLLGLYYKTALSLCQNGQYRVNAGSNSLLKLRAPGKKESNLLKDDFMVSGEVLVLCVTITMDQTLPL